ncbi:MAG TPA: OmpH family outer membrane protein [Pirellulales bacterium]
MKTTFRSVAVAAAVAVVVGYCSSLFAQQMAPPGQGAAFGQGPTGAPMSGAPAGMSAAPRGATPSMGSSQLGLNGIAVVDVAYIFKHYEKFKQQMEQMKARVDQAEQALKADADNLKKMADQQKQYTPGSDAYKKMEADMLKLQADWNVKKSLKGKEFMDQEGAVYFNVSREIDLVVKQLAVQNGVVLVLKFNGESVDPNDHNDILRGINKPIVYYDARMDITPNVLDQLNRGNVGTGNVGVRMPQPGAQPPR